MLHGYVRTSEDSLTAYAAGRPLRLHTETDMRRPTRLADRAVGSAMLAALQEGDTLAVPTLVDLVDYPSDAVRIARALAGRGVELKILEPIGVAPAGAAFSHLEAELARVRAELSQVQQNADARVEHARKEIVAQMVGLYGAPPVLTNGMPNGAGDVSKPLAAGSMGTALRKARERRGLSQHALAQELGIPQSAISRSENNSQQPPGALLEHLFGGATSAPLTNGAAS